MVTSSNLAFSLPSPTDLVQSCLPVFRLKAVTSVHPGYLFVLLRLAASEITTVEPSLVISGEAAQLWPVSGSVQISLPVSGS